MIGSSEEARLEPLYDIRGGPVPEEHEAEFLDGYRGMGPVRVGNQARHQIQHDVYGAAILAAERMFTDRGVARRGDRSLFAKLEALGEHAARLFDVPDAGPWELRGIERVHTFSSLMCWAACDRLARIAAQLGGGVRDRATYWSGHAARIHAYIIERAWNSDLGCFTATIDGDALDASLLRMHELGFLDASDSRFVGTVEAIERGLRRGQFIFRYVEKDDFGEPENAFLVCTFWHVNALAAIGRREEARRLFEATLACRNPHGLLAEHIDPRTKEQWGNFVQTYSMAGIIETAVRLAGRA